MARLQRTVANASPTSRPLTLARTGATERTGAGLGAGVDTVETVEGGGVFAWPEIPITGADDGAGAAGRGAVGAAAGAGVAPAAGRRMEGPPAGLGGREIRTVCFFWAASAGFGGSGLAPGAPGGGLVSDITLSAAT